MENATDEDLKMHSDIEKRIKIWSLDAMPNNSVTLIMVQALIERIENLEAKLDG